MCYFVGYGLAIRIASLCVFNLSFSRLATSVGVIAPFLSLSLSLSLAAALIFDEIEEIMSSR